MSGTPQAIVDGLIRNKTPERVALHGSPWRDTIVAWVEQGYPTRLVHKEIGEDR